MQQSNCARLRMVLPRRSCLVKSELASLRKIAAASGRWAMPARACWPATEAEAMPTDLIIVMQNLTMFTRRMFARQVGPYVRVGLPALLALNAWDVMESRGSIKRRRAAGIRAEFTLRWQTAAYNSSAM